MKPCKLNNEKSILMKTAKQIFIYLQIAALFAGCNIKSKNKEFPAEMVKFNPYSGNPVFTGTGENTWDKNIRERGFILQENNEFKLWYTGYNPELSDEKYLGYATSGDGIHWERFAGNPIFKDKWTEDMFVLKNGGEYYMYAEGYKDVAHMLTSADGIHWQEHGDLRILTARGDTIPGPYGTPSVLIENGQWYLFYERNDLGIWLAKSDDKITWTNVQDEPVLPRGPDKYDIGAVAANQVIKHKGKYYMYYHATTSTDWQHPSTPPIWTSNVAMSTDLIHWKKYDGNPIVNGDYSSPILVYYGEKSFLYTMHPVVCRYIPE
jgi:sucrose-6-phosphate hydrolase SacC (GH32 family)